MKTNQDKVAIVTGSSRGIGAAIAKRLAADGVAIVVNYAGRIADPEKVVTNEQERMTRGFGHRLFQLWPWVHEALCIETVDLCLQPLKGFGAHTAALKQLFGSRDLRARSRRRVAPGCIACRQAQHKNIYESTKEVGDDHNLNKSQHRYL